MAQEPVSRQYWNHNRASLDSFWRGRGGGSWMLLATGVGCCWWWSRVIGEMFSFPFAFFSFGLAAGNGGQGGAQGSSSTSEALLVPCSVLLPTPNSQPPPHPLVPPWPTEGSALQRDVQASACRCFSWTASACEQQRSPPLEGQGGESTPQNGQGENQEGGDCKQLHPSTQ